MRSTIEQQIQALTQEFIDDLVALVRQHTLEVVLAQLEGGALGAPVRPRAKRVAPVEAAVTPRPKRRNAQRSPRQEELAPSSALQAAEPPVPEPVEPAEEQVVELQPSRAPTSRTRARKPAQRPHEPAPETPGADMVPATDELAGVPST